MNNFRGEIMASPSGTHSNSTCYIINQKHTYKIDLGSLYQQLRGIFVPDRAMIMIDKGKDKGKRQSKVFRYQGHAWVTTINSQTSSKGDIGQNTLRNKVGHLN